MITTPISGTVKGEQTMETNLEVLNKISQKLGGSADATSVTESLNNIANALGDTNPDVIKSVSDSLNDILEYAGGGGLDLNGKMIISFVNNSSGPVLVTGSEDIALYYEGFLRRDADKSEAGINNFTISSNDSKEFTYYALIKSQGVDEAFFTPSDLILAGSGIELSISDTVNCFYEDDEISMDDDLYSVSSCTITIQDA